MFVQRRYPRYDATVSIDVTNREGRSLSRSTQSISLGGLYVASGEYLPEGETVDLRLDLPTGSFEAYGTVVYVITKLWHTPRIDSGMGIRFDEILPEQAHRLASYIHTLRERIRGRVLIVDDDRYFANMLRSLLRGADYSVSIADDPETALDILEFGEIDVVVAEAHPQGLQLVDQARQHPRISDDLGFVVTARDAVDRTDRRAAAQMGVSAVLRKPFYLDTFVDAVELAFGR